MKIPTLSLSFGQVTWALSLGQEPKPFMRDKLNYLRQLGIPFSRDERPVGQGNRVRYGYEDMVELGVGFFALMHGMRPADVSRVLVGDRENMRRLYRQTLEEQPEAALHAHWVKSRGKAGVLPGEDIVLRLHDRYSETPGKFEIVPVDPEDFEHGAPVLAQVEVYDGQAPRRLVPLTQLALQWTAWALEAPDIRTGPKT